MRNNQTNRILASLLLSALPLFSAQGARAEREPSPSSIQPGETVRVDHGAADIRRDLFHAELAPGVFLFAVAATGPGKGRPVVSFAGPLGSAPAAREEAFTVLEQAPAWQLVEILEDGTYEVAVAGEDPALPLAPYRLDSSFAERAPLPDETRFAPNDLPDSCAVAPAQIKLGPFV